MTPASELHPMRCETCEAWMDRFYGSWPKCPMHHYPASVLEREFHTFIEKCGCASHTSAPAPAQERIDAVELLAALEHEQWMVWASDIEKTERISSSRHVRWKKLMVPYRELSEEMKEHDRVWARKAIALLQAGDPHE